jgi:beta-lactamase regulating signal transducer with metallopeptidase domain
MGGAAGIGATAARVATSAPVAAGPASAVTLIEQPPRPINWARVIVLVWLAGASLIGLRLLVGVARLWVLSRRSTMVTDGAWLQAAHATARQLGLTHGVTLLRGADGGAPMTWGVLRPVVWLPSVAGVWPPELRAAVLSHELAHVKRRDAVTQWLANIAVAIHWFNPIVWAAARSLRVEREHACDDAVLALGARADEYAGQLLEMVRELGTMSAGPAPALAMARRSQLEGRLLAILDRAAERRPVPSTRVLAVATFALVFVGVLGGARVTRGAVPGDGAPDFVAYASTVAQAVSAERAASAIPVPRQQSGRAAAATTVAQVEAQAVVAEGRPKPPPAQRTITDGEAWNRIRETMLGSGETPAASARAAPGGGSFDADRALPPVSLLPPSSSFAGVRAPAPASTAISRPPAADARSMLKDGSRADSALLQALARQGMRPDSGLLMEIIAASEGISSSESRVSVLERIARMSSLDSGVVTALARASMKVPSTSMRSKLVRALIEQQPHARGASRGAVLAAINSISSVAEQGVLLELFLSRGEVTTEALVDALTAAGRMPGSVAKTKVLVTAAKGQRIEGPARRAYLRTAGTIETNSERVRALTALLDPGDPPR